MIQNIDYFPYSFVYYKFTINLYYMWGICHSAYAKDAPWHTLEFVLLLVNEFKLATKEFECFVAEILPHLLRKKI